MCPTRIDRRGTPTARAASTKSFSFTARTDPRKSRAKIGICVTPTAIIDVAGLGFLGLGPPDPATAEWGTMLTDTTRYLQTAPHLALIPGAAIVVAVLGFNLIGDGLREALDPRFRGRA